MDGTPYFVMGLLLGIGLTLSIQFLANRKVRKALAELAARPPVVQSEEVLFQRRETQEIGRRLAVLEQIVTDEPRRLATEIDRLR